jgi:hypothetical protein
MKNKNNFKDELLTAQIEHNMKYHAATPQRNELYDANNEALRIAAHTINANCPNSTEKDEAIKCIELARFWANAAIARAPQLPGEAVDLIKKQMEKAD